MAIVEHLYLVSIRITHNEWIGEFCDSVSGHNTSIYYSLQRKSSDVAILYCGVTFNRFYCRKNHPLHLHSLLFLQVYFEMIVKLMEIC